MRGNAGGFVRDDGLAACDVLGLPSVVAGDRQVMTDEVRHLLRGTFDERATCGVTMHPTALAAFKARFATCEVA